MHGPRKGVTGFTIIELLIVVVVIAILATLVIVSYNGIAARAHDSELRSDLETASKQLAMYNVQNNTYPSSQVSDAGVKDSTDTHFLYTFNPGDNTYCLTGTNSGVSYTVTANQTTPGQYACVSTLAGSPTGQAGNVDGTGTSALFSDPGYPFFAADGNIYIMDQRASGAQPFKIRKINPANAAVTTIFSVPVGISANQLAVKSDGTIYFISVYPMCVKKLVGSTLSDLSCSASFSYPYGLAVGSDGNIYVADSNDSTIKKVDATTGATTVLAGAVNVAGYVDSPTGTSARFSTPSGITAAPDGNLYIADNGNNRIRKVTLAGAVTTVAGVGTASSSDGPAMQASIQPVDITSDAQGSIFFTDTDAHVRSLISGTVSTLASGRAFPGALGLTASRTTAGIIYVTSYNDNRTYKLQ